MSQKNLIEIGLLIYPDSLLSAIYGLTDLFRIANFSAGRHDGVKRAQMRVTHWKSSGDAMECIYDSHPDAEHDPTFVVLPPSIIEPVPEQLTAPISEWLRERHDHGATMCSVCAGSFVLAEAGLLKGRDATTHWMFETRMAQRFPDIKVDADKMVIDDGDIITAGGIMAWTDLGLRIVHRVMGPTLMMETARILLIDPPSREQSFYSVFVPNLTHGDAQILKVQHWLQKTGARDVDMAAMSKMAGMEERTFLRRFSKATGHKPTEYCQQVRVAKAREMLEFTQQNIEQVTWSVGYEDPSAFRKVFQKIVGLGPGEYRQRFGVTMLKVAG